MRKISIICGLVVLSVLSGCDKHDPILPGERTSIFDTTKIKGFPRHKISKSYFRRKLYCYCAIKHPPWHRHRSVINFSSLTSY